MKKLFLFFIVTLFLNNSIFAASTLSDPHFVRLVSVGQKHLINKKVCILLINNITVSGTMLDYTSFDCMIISRVNNKITIFPLTAILSITVVEEK